MNHNYLSTLFTLSHPNETQQLCKMQMQNAKLQTIEIQTNKTKILRFCILHCKRT